MVVIMFVFNVNGCWYLYYQGSFVEHYPDRLCDGDVQVIVAYQTSPSNHFIRSVIRKSVGHGSVKAALPWRIVFYMGYTEARRTNTYLKRELVHDDLIVVLLQHRADSEIPIFLEAARWINNRCSRSLRYLVHANDSTFVDVMGLHEYMGNLTGADRHFHCILKRLEPVERNTALTDAFPGSTFPAYCEGGTFFLGARYLPSLLVAADAIPRYSLFAQYITGQLSVPMKLRHKDISERIGLAAYNQEERKLFLLGVKKSYKWKKLWLRSSICYTDTNLTWQLSESILRKINID